MTTRKYSSVSQETTLTAALNSSATTMVVASSTAVLGGVTLGNTSPLETLVLVIDPDTALEEIVEVTYPSSSGSNTLTVVRGVDGTNGIAHSAGAKVRHMAIGRDFREANTHIENTTTAHGLTLANVTLSTGTGNVSTAMLAANAVTTAKITDANVTTAKIADGAITSAKIADLGIATGDIADSAITSGKIATGAVGTTKIDDLSITTGKIVDGAVTSAKILDGTIATGDLADGAVTSAKIADGTIVDADINSAANIAKTKLALTGAITSTDIANDTIVDADINTAANIAWTKIAPSATVSATELGYLDGVTSAIQTQIDSKLATATATSTYAPLASPALTGTPTAPTAAANTNTTQIATTAYVQTELADLVNSAPAALDTLNELAASLGNDANFATTVTNSLAGKLSLTGGTMSGAIAMGTNKITGLGTPTVSTDAATKNYVDTVTVAPSNLTGPITSVGSATSVAAQTGTGSTFVMQTSPTLTTPNIGVATATSVNGTTIPTSKTLVVTTDKISTLAATTSAELAGVITDETGSGALVFGTSPTLSLPSIDNPRYGYTTTATSAGTTTLTVSSTFQQFFTGTTTHTVVLPVASTMTLGQGFYVENNSTGNLTVNSSGGNLVATVIPGTTILFTCILTSGTTAASWDVDYHGFTTVTGTGSVVLATSPTLVTPVLGVATATSINGTTIPSSKTLVATDSTQYVVPSQTGNSGKYLTTNGTVSSWGTVDALPSQTSNAGKYLTTDGTTASWATVTTDPTADIFMMMGA